MMDLTELRASSPGIYEAAVEEGTARERERVCVHLKLAAAAGASPLRAIEQGWTAEEALPRYREVASKANETASAFLKTVSALGLNGGTGAGERGLTAAARKLAASMGRGVPVGSMDAGDIVATIVTGRKPDGSKADAVEPIVIAPENNLRNYTHEEASRRVAEIVTGKKVAP